MTTASRSLPHLLTGVPNYIWGLLIIILILVPLEIVGELRGTHDPSLTPGFNLPFILDILKHAALPIITYVVASLGTWMLNYEKQHHERPQ